MSDRPTLPERLLVVSHVVHYRHGDQLYAYGPFAREIAVWADLFATVAIAAPCRDTVPPADSLPFARSNIRLKPIRETGGVTAGAKVRQVLLLPVLIAGLIRAMRAADAIHVRCPGNLGLLGCLLAPVFSRRIIAKYAGQWSGYDGEPWTVRLQRLLLRSRWWTGPVLVYGHRGHQPRHVVPFFTSVMTDRQVKMARAVAATKQMSSPLRVVYAGRLDPAKRIDALLEATAMLVKRQVDLELVIVGDGPDRENLEATVQRLSLGRLVRFLGALPFDATLEWYSWAHCVVLPSRHSEGWPKMIAEGMAFGLIAIAVDHGQLASMLDGRGILVREGTAAEIADALQQVVNEPGKSLHLAQRGSEWAARHSLDRFGVALREVLLARWPKLSPLHPAGTLERGM